VELPKKTEEGVASSFERLVRISNGWLPIIKKTQELAAERLRLLPPARAHGGRKFLEESENFGRFRDLD